MTAERARQILAERGVSAGAFGITGPVDAVLVACAEDTRELLATVASLRDALDAEREKKEELQEKMAQEMSYGKTLWPDTPTDRKRR